MRYGIFGAGAIGAYLGGRLAQAGAEVVLIGRGALAEEARKAGGLELIGLRGDSYRAPVQLTEDVRALENCGVVLVAVRTLDTLAAGETLSRVLKPGAVVFSCQNGVSNPEVLARSLGAERVAGGVVTCNVVIQGARLSQSTGGPILLGRPALAPRAAEQLASDLRASGLAAEVRDDMEAALWGKLLLNLGNSIGALTDLPIASFLADPAGRAVYAAAIEEGLGLLRAAGIAPARVGRTDPRLVLRFLRTPLPRFLARLLVRRMYGVTDEARSSTSRDLNAGRATEIDSLNGALVRLAEKFHQAAPVNRTLTQLVQEAERQGTSPRLPPKDLLARVLAAR
jgi:2-dehydropantoate 2-reductase